MTLTPAARRALTGLREGTSPDLAPAVQGFADAIRKSLPDLDDLTIARVILDICGLLTALAQSKGERVPLVDKYLGLGGAVAAELAALEIDGRLGGTRS